MTDCFFYALSVSVLFFVFGTFAYGLHMCQCTTASCCSLFQCSYTLSSFQHRPRVSACFSVLTLCPLSNTGLVFQPVSVFLHSVLFPTPASCCSLFQCSYTLSSFQHRPRVSACFSVLTLCPLSNTGLVLQPVSVFLHSAFFPTPLC